MQCKRLVSDIKQDLWLRNVRSEVKADAHHAWCCSSPRSLQLLDEILQLLPFNVAIPCRQTAEHELV